MCPRPSAVKVSVDTPKDETYTEATVRSTRFSPLHHWMKLNAWGPGQMSDYLGINRVSVFRLETYQRKPSQRTLDLIAALPNFPLSAAALWSDYESNVEPRRKRPRQERRTA
jgi:hypothetical protein